MTSAGAILAAAVKLRMPDFICDSLSPAERIEPGFQNIRTGQYDTRMNMSSSMVHYI